jgi:hypothetical protein
MALARHIIDGLNSVATGKPMIISHNRCYKNEGCNTDGSVYSDRRPGGQLAQVNGAQINGTWSKSVQINGASVRGASLNNYSAIAIIYPRRELLWLSDR